MVKKTISRRDFLRVSALAAAGAALVSCGPKATEAPVAPGEEKPGVDATEAPVAPPAEGVVLDIMALAEYQAPYQEIWNIYAGENPGITANVFAINEDTAAAYEAKVAGGYMAAIELTQEMQIFFDKNNYEMAMDLSTLEFDWWDRFTFDAKNAWSDLFGLPGPRSLDFMKGHYMSWQYNGDAMKEAGLDPRNDVRSYDDMVKWLNEGQAFVDASGGKYDAFWKQAWHNWIFGNNYSECFTNFFADGSADRRVACWKGEAKFNAEDSPYRHWFQFYLDAKDNGWVSADMPNLLWENDMEATYISGKTIMMVHGPWVWDKAAAAGSTFEQVGLPATPPADMEAWKQFALPVNIDNQWFLRAGVDKTATWANVQHAWNWFFSPEIIPLRCDAEGRMPLYTLDEPFETKGQQWQSVGKEIGVAGGAFGDKTEWDEGLTGLIMASPRKKKGSKGVFDWESNGLNVWFANLYSGKWTVQDCLDEAQKNYEESYEAA